jgi:hypothetical protein
MQAPLRGGLDRHTPLIGAGLVRVLANTEDQKEQQAASGSLAFSFRAASSSGYQAFSAQRLDVSQRSRSGDNVSKMLSLQPGEVVSF